MDTFDKETIKQVDNAVINSVKDAFVKIDSDYFNAKIDPIVSERLQQKLAANREMTFDLFEDIEESDNKLTGGAVAIVAMIINKCLYIANCGNSVAFLVKHGSDPDELHAFQASELHESHEVKEIARLQKTLVDPMVIFGPSRCFGDYFRKSGYSENPYFRTALAEPVCVEPSVLGRFEVSKQICSGSVIKFLTILVR